MMSGCGTTVLDISTFETSTRYKGSIVTGLLKINVPAEMCEECLQGKQHKSIFSKDAGHMTKHHLEVVYSDVCGSMQVDSYGGNRYFVIFIDDFSRKLWT
ncbi:unnamed protein product [Vicia faba]|uniref:Uncharacterized protein n=1 Tax=Vicia faba TaxID=3906 RepID=A0AAV0YYQ6_VICFA|nr:unnamed protein product [Vicia faba]